MEKQKTGWISLSRSIQDNFLWTDKPFSRGQAWIDLLLLVNHKDNKFMMKGKAVEVKRGQRITSLSQLSDKWGWSTTKVRTFLKTLEREEMITFETTKSNTVLTVVNWDLYQGGENTENTQKTQWKHSGNTTETHREHSGNTQKNTNNNDNKEKKENNEEKEDKKHGTVRSTDRTNVIPLRPLHQLIKNEVSDVAFNAWFEYSNIYEVNNKIVIEPPTPLNLKTIKERYLEQLKNIFGKEIELNTKNIQEATENIQEAGVI